MSVVPGSNYTRTLTNGIAGLTSVTVNPFSPLEHGRQSQADGNSARGDATGTAVANGSCDLTATPGC